ncbi:MAG TPA: glycosyltransferase family 39 protein [Candidatus Acidoferrales bacterium]|nr:glycosyltransferase family 39 protein [Candidatus Acidoferrales bacterium]
MGKKSREKRERIRPEASTAVDTSREPSPSEPLWSEESRPAAAASAGNLSPWLLPLALGILALVVRGFLLSQVARTPYLEVDNIDAKGYQVWANQILGGEWLPHHHFYQSPLYAYYLAIVYAIFGQGPWTPRVIQILLGSVSVVLVYFIGRRIFSQRVGIVAAVMMAVYGPMIVEEIMLAKTALVVFSMLVALALYLRAIARNSLSISFVAGLAFGFSIIGVGQWLIVWLLLAAYVMLEARLSIARRSTLAAAFLVGGMLCIAPLAAWNSYWGGGLMLTSGDAGLNLYLGNNPLATGLPGRPPGLRDVPQFEENDAKTLAERDAGHPLTPAGVSAYWSHRASTWAVENPSAFIAATMKKLVVLLNAYEIPDSYHYTFIREMFIPAFWGCLTFAIVMPLAIIGMVLVFGHKPARSLYIVCLTYLAVIVLVYVRARYRIPAVPFLILFAAAAIDWAVAAVQRRQWSFLVAAGIALGAVGAFVNHDYCEPARGNVPAICLSGDTFYDLEWMKLAEWHRDHNDLSGELDYLKRAMQVSTPRGPGQLNFWYAEAEFRSGEAQTRAGNPEVARQHDEASEQAYQRALARKYRVAEVNNNLALVYQSLGQTDRALQSIDAAHRAQPNDLGILRHGLRLTVEIHRCDLARQWFDEIEKRIPGDQEAQRMFSSCSTS